MKAEVVLKVTGLRCENIAVILKNTQLKVACLAGRVSKKMISTFMTACFLSPACVCEGRLITLAGVIKAEWTSGFVQWHGSHFMALPDCQWLCFIIVPCHCAALNGPSCHLSFMQCYPAWEWHFYTVRATNDMLLTSYLNTTPTTHQQLLELTQLVYDIRSRQVLLYFA